MLNLKYVTSKTIRIEFWRYDGDVKQNVERQVYSPPEIAGYLGISQSGAYNLFNSKDFPSFRIGGRWMVTKQAFEKWLAEQQEVKNACN